MEHKKEVWDLDDLCNNLVKKVGKMKVFIVIAITAMFILSIYFVTTYNRYQGITLPHENSYYGKVVRDDSIYVLDTHTGECKRKV